MGRRLRHNELTMLSGALEILYSASDLLSLPHRVIKTLDRLFHQEQASFTLIDAASGQFVFSLLEPLPAGWQKLRQAVEAYAHLHPLGEYIPKVSEKIGVPGGSGRISDALSLTQWKRHPLYNEYFRAVGLTRQMASLDLVDPARVLSVAVDRSGRDFSLEDRQAFDLLRPHFGQAYRVACASEKLRLELAAAHARNELAPHQENGAALLCEVDAEGRLRWGVAQTAALLARYNLGTRPLSSRSPHLLQRFLARLRKADAGRNERWLGASARSLRVRDAGDGELTVHAAASAEPDRWQLLLHEKHLLAEPSAGPERLTAREREVLDWVAQGKTNWEISTILEIAPRTVGKHLEHLYEKLGVDNRTAAARLALERRIIGGVE